MSNQIFEFRRELVSDARSTNPLRIQPAATATYLPDQRLRETLKMLKKHQKQLDIAVNAYIATVELGDNCEEIRSLLDGFKQKKERMDDPLNWGSLRRLIANSNIKGDLAIWLKTEDEIQTDDYTRALATARKAVNSALQNPQGGGLYQSADEAQVSAEAMSEYVKDLTDKARAKVQDTLKTISDYIEELAEKETLSEQKPSLNVSPRSEEYVDKQQREVSVASPSFLNRIKEVVING